MVTKAGGVALGAHGVDQCVTGGRQVWSGRDVRSLTETGVSSLAQSFGASPAAARNMGTAVDILVPVGGATLAGAVRAGAIRAGRISLMRHEAQAGSRLGGHTIERHIGWTESQVRQRLVDTASLRRPPAMISTFDDIAAAERSVTRGLFANRTRIQAWAQGAATTNLPLEYTVGREVGYGISRATGQVERLSKIRIVLRKETYNGMPFFILTAFPV
jgi:hypothetical protein